MRLWRLMAALLSFLLFIGLNRVAGSTHARKKFLPQTNFLFIMYDDLRPELSIYGKKHIISPNFERLAAEGVTFDLAISQVAVCNPSRNSLLTGLRPDTIESWNFQSTSWPHKLLPEYLIRAGYKTQGIGKIRHWEGDDKYVWTEGQNNFDWYDYQNKEWNFMNSSVMPDSEKKEDSFPDHIFATKAIESLRKFATENKSWWMTAVGFKMPHLSLHVPKRYYDMYSNMSHVWKNLPASARKFPNTSYSAGYRCCADIGFRFMQNKGAKRSIKSEILGDMNHVTSEDMYAELMQGYAAAVTFVDYQLGRVLDAIDELKLWNNLTIVLTADHGMHNGEKGIWEKWTLFDESTRVPLIITNPHAAYKGSHHFDPVELLDIVPTVLDLVSSPHIRGKNIPHLHGGRFHQRRQHVGTKMWNTATNALSSLYSAISGVEQDTIAGTVHAYKLKELAGKSLAPLVVGGRYHLTLSPPLLKGGGHAGASHNIRASGHGHRDGGLIRHGYAISQTIRCANKKAAKLLEMKREYASTNKLRVYDLRGTWQDCDIRSTHKDRLEDERKGKYVNEEMLMGYSLRTASYRYTLWIRFDRVELLPDWDHPIVDEELYDHSQEELGDLGTFELVNHAKDPMYTEQLIEQRTLLTHLLHHQIVFKNINSTLSTYSAAEERFTDNYLKGKGSSSAE